MKKKNQIQGNRPMYLLLLPRPFRFTGAAILLCTLAFIFVYEQLGLSVALPLSSVAYKHTIESLIIIGMLFIACARRKNEDERSIHIRFQAVSWSFLWVTIWFLLSPMLKTIWNLLYTDGGFQIVLILLFVYWITNESLIRLNR